MSSSDVPSAPEPAVQRGARLLAEGQAAEAARVLRRVVDEAPVYAAAHVLLAAALDADGRPAEALDVWHRAAFLVPSSPLVQRERRRLLGGAPAPEAEAAMPRTAATSEPSTPPASAVPLPEPAAAPEPTDAPAPETMSVAAPAEPPVATDERSAFAPPAPSTSTEAPADGFADPDTPAGVPSSVEPEHRAEVERPVAEATPREADLPEGAHVAPAGELFTHVPTSDAASTPEAPPAEASPAEPVATLHGGAEGVPPPAPDSAAPPPPTRLAAPDWGDLDDLAVSVLPPSRPAAPPPPPTDAGGWTLLGEEERAAPRRGTVRPPVVPPDDWVPPADERPSTPLDAPTRPAEASDAEAPALADDLDALIESLETAPRITPDPDFDAPAPDLDGNVDDLASETLAKIYAAQHQYVEAAVVYERLAARTPAQADALLERAAEMRRHADDA